MSKKLIFIILALTVAPAYSVENFKISDYGAGVQIWFEVEDFDERNPDDDSRFALSDEPGAFGRSINSLDVGDDGSGFVRYTFDISTAGGSAGTWYFWGRVINPSNQSDFMLVDGHPGDQTPVTTLPVSGLANGQRVFEENVGSAGTWGWSGDNHNEGHTKELRDGENTMWILNRQSGAIWDVMMWTDDPGYTPTDDDYINALPGKPSGKALRPDPEDGAMISQTWVSTTWKPGAFAVSHDVYMGEDFDEVNEATVDSPLYRGNLTSDNFIAGFTGFPYPDGLVPGGTYYWRVDAVNDADPNSPWKGDVWSFRLPPTNAYDPSPSDGGRYVDLDVTLTWQPGFDAKVHSIVFGDDFDEVSNAPAGSPLADATFTPGVLEGDKTYYWRVDEMNPPTTVKGEVWSFTTLPDIPIVDPNLVAWYKFEIGEGDKIIDFSGHENHGDIVGEVLWAPGQFNMALEFLGDNFGHVEMPAGLVTTSSGSIMMWVNTDLTDNEGMFWYGTAGGGDGFGDQDEIHIHVDDPGVLGFAIEGNPDVRLDGPQIAGEGWNHVAATWDATDGCKLYFNAVEVDSQANTGNVADLSAIRLGRPIGTGNGNRYHRGFLDDVRLFDHAITAAQVEEIMSKGEDPLKASSPKPSNGGLVGIDDALPLSWSPGEEAASHDVYFGLEKEAVANADTSDTTGVYRGNQNTTTFTPAEGVEWGGGPYYWRIDENNNDGTVSEGGIWSFSVADFIPVEDFESYTDNDAENEAIWQHWIDGFGVPTNGSQVGYLLPPYAEQTIVHSGAQSMPLSYNNTAGVTNSEAVLTLTEPRDWTKHDVGVLSIWFQGRAPSVGSFTQAGGTFTITSTGADIWNDSDEFHFAYRTLTGAGEIVAKVESVENTHNWAKAGVMIRETLDADSKFAAVYIMPTNPDGTATNGCRFQAREDTGIDAVSDTGTETAEQTAITAPYWVKLERDVAGSFRAYYSSNGTSWTPITWRPLVSMESTVFVGLALTSHNNNAVCEANFSNVTITGNVSGQWASQDIGIAANDAEPLYVSLANANGTPAVVTHPDPAAANITTWTEWVIPLQEFTDKGINLSNVDKIAIGLGSTGGASSGGSGVMYIDDIRLYRSAEGQ